MWIAAWSQKVCWCREDDHHLWHWLNTRVAVTLSQVTATIWAQVFSASCFCWELAMRKAFSAVSETQAKCYILVISDQNFKLTWCWKDVTTSFLCSAKEFLLWICFHSHVSLKRSCCKSIYQKLVTGGNVWQTLTWFFSSINISTAWNLFKLPITSHILSDRLDVRAVCQTEPNFISPKTQNAKGCTSKRQSRQQAKQWSRSLCCIRKRHEPTGSPNTASFVLDDLLSQHSQYLYRCGKRRTAHKEYQASKKWSDATKTRATQHKCVAVWPKSLVSK